MLGSVGHVGDDSTDMQTMWWNFYWILNWGEAIENIDKGLAIIQANCGWWNLKFMIAILKRPPL